MRNFFSSHHARSAFPFPAYAAEVGRAGFVMSGMLAFAGSVVEYVRPGTFFSYLAPQHLAAVIAAFGALALFNDHPKKEGLVGTAILALTAVVFAAAAFALVDPYMASSGEEGRWLSFAAAFAAFLPFFLFRRFGVGDHD
jgi:hypothetical protein